MSLTSAYLITTKNLDAVLNAVQSAQAPERFSNKFLESLDFTSSNDRLYIKLFKELGFVDDSGVPKQRYYDFLDAGQAKSVMAAAVREAYGDLFAVNKTAWKMAVEEVKNKFRTLTQGKKSDNVLSLMANTFKALADYADWETVEPPQKPKDQEDSETKGLKKEEESEPPIRRPDGHARLGQLHYNIQIHLPDSRDPAVFDAIFQGLKKHLL